jgi:hypothetical protein
MGKHNTLNLILILPDPKIIKNKLKTLMSDNIVFILFMFFMRLDQLSVKEPAHMESGVIETTALSSYMALGWPP